MQKSCLLISLISTILFCTPAFAVQNITGIWEGLFDSTKHIKISINGREIQTVRGAGDTNPDEMAEQHSSLLLPEARLQGVQKSNHSFKMNDLLR